MSTEPNVHEPATGTRCCLPEPECSAQIMIACIEDLAILAILLLSMHNMATSRSGLLCQVHTTHENYMAISILKWTGIGGLIFDALVSS
jgi:hypothetical protein